MKFIDLFSGIGGFRTGMEMNGHECVAFCEIDKYARQSYKAIYDTEGEEELHDITKWTDEHVRQFVRDRGHIDVITGGFPCQSFSIAGKRGGFDDTRGTLFFEIMRIANIVRPQYLFLENVKGLLNHDGGATFETILNTLDEFGYDAEWQVLNSKNFGVPQNRERVFIIGLLRGSGGRTVFPVGGENGSTNCNLVGLLDIKGKEQTRRVYSVDGLSPTLTTMQGGGQEPKIVKEIKLELVGSLGLEGYAEMSNRVYSQEGLARTLMGGGGNAGDKTGLYLEEKPHYRVRKLTPLECWRLQGFTDEQFYKAKNDGVSNSQLYKQAGNSVTVNVIDAIAKRL